MTVDEKAIFDKMKSEMAAWTAGRGRKTEIKAPGKRKDFDRDFENVKVVRKPRAAELALFAGGGRI